MTRPLAEVLARSWALALVGLLANGCGGSCSAGRSRSAAAEADGSQMRPPPVAPPTAPPTPAPAPPPLVLRPVGFGWGSTGVVAARAPVPTWTIGLVDAESTAAVRELRLVRVELLDADGGVLTRAVRDLELRVAPADRSARDFSSFGTEPLDGGLPAGRTVRLWVHARAPDDFEPVGTAPPARFRVVLLVDGAAEATVEGPLEGPWPTA